MGHPSRIDIDGGSFHVMNQSVGRRQIFQTPSDFRYFLARLACSVRRGEIEVLAFALLFTHFHLFVRSRGGLSRSLQRIQDPVARRFNRQRDRRGPLYRGRFLSKPVHGPTHMWNVVRYIDENPVQARLSSRPERYRWCSAYLYAQPRRPAWLSPEWVDANFSYGPDAPASPPDVVAARAAFIEARLSSRSNDADPLGDLLVSKNVLAWLEQRARIADGTVSTPPVAGSATVVSAVKALVGQGDRVRLPPGKQQDAQRVMLVGLMRDLARSGYPEIARASDCPESTAKRHYRLHQRCILELDGYARRAEQVVNACVAPLRQGMP